MTDTTKTPCGIIMGYYGKIWSKDDLIEYATFCKNNGYKYFIYGPKMDNYLRSNWKTPWPTDIFNELLEVRQAFKTSGVDFGVAFSPIDVHTLTDTLKADLKKRIEKQINALNLDILSIGFDDYNHGKFEPYRETMAQAQVDTAKYIKTLSNATSYYVVPTYYSKDPLTVMANGQVPKNYWPTFGTLSNDFEIFWCGSAIIPNGFSVNEITEMNAIFNRPVTIWDNYPCNDPSWMTRAAANAYAFTGRPSELGSVINGHFANPMLQPELSKIPLMTLPKIYTESSKYQAQKEYEDATLAICKNSELSNFMIHNIMSFREVSYRPDYGVCVQYMQKTIQPLKGSEKVKQELEDWFEFVLIKGIPQIVLPKDLYLPQGHYFLTSTDIHITIEATCTNLLGYQVPSSLSYSADQTGNLTDISNTNGQLTLESNGPLVQNPNTELGKYIPAGSYQLTSQAIKITISALCLNNKQIGVPSTLIYLSSDVSSFTEIKNIDGVLTIIKNP